MKKDFLGKSIETGDQVVFVIKDYRSLGKGTVASTSNKTLLITYTDFYGNTRTLRQFYGQVVKIPMQES